MTIVLVGGGSGGHITPLLAVARELKRIEPSLRLVYVGERRGQFGDIARTSGLFDECRYIFAGKIRRYYGEPIWKRLTDIRTIALNIRDLIYLVIGTVQSIVIFQRLNASSALLKGGFVCVPVAFGCKLAGVKTVTHDSDVVPGLSNRIASKYSSIHAVAMPAKYYSYPVETLRVVGVPINPEFAKHKHGSSSLLKKYGVTKNAPAIVVTGGSQGSRRLNAVIVEILPKLVKLHPKIKVFHHVGDGNQDQYSALAPSAKAHVQLFDFTDKMYELSAISDVVVTRAGATTLAEFASQKKACIIIPHPELAGDHQTKNAQVWKDIEAGEVLSEQEVLDDSETLLNSLQRLLSDKHTREVLGNNAQLLVPKTPASEALARILLELAGEN